MERTLPETDRPVTPVVIKKYANRRLYDTESSIYITLDTLAGMVRQSRDFVVFDAKTGDDITRSVLTQIIVEEETKGRNMLPTVFLRQLIGFYGDSMQGLVPGYLEQIMDQFAAQQRAAAQPQKPGKPVQAAADPARTGVPIIERAKNLLTPFYRPGGSKEGEVVQASASGAAEDAHLAEIRSLRAEIERLTRELAAHKAAPGPAGDEPPDRGLGRVTRG